jgi:hypothetical protein
LTPPVIFFSQSGGWPPHFVKQNKTTHRIIRRIKIEDDFTRWTLVRFQKNIEEETSYRHRIVTDLVITRRLQLAQLQPIERRFAGYWSTLLASRCQLARQHRHQRIVP